MQPRWLHLPRSSRVRRSNQPTRAHEGVGSEGTGENIQSIQITTGVGEVTDFVLKAKKMVDVVLQSVPHAAPAALPWAGVCLGLQVRIVVPRSFTKPY